LPRCWPSSAEVEASSDQAVGLLIAALIGAFFFVMIRTARLSDDSYIDLRTIDNFLHGYGLLWNVAERVQSFTDPLWLFLLTACVFVTHEARIELALDLSVTVIGARPVDSFPTGAHRHS
jgi:hypothetical protein